MLTSVVTLPINHVLHSESWACKRLQSFAGKTVCVRIPPLLHFNVLIAAEGKVQPVDRSMHADTSFLVSPLILPGLFAREPSAFEQIKVTGDADLADELINMVKQIHWQTIVAHDLSKMTGDIPAHRIAQAGGHLVQWQVDNVYRLSRAAAEYLTEENVFLIKSTAISQFADEIQHMQRHTEQLEQRINRLMQQRPFAHE